MDTIEHWTTSKSHLYCTIMRSKFWTPNTSIVWARALNAFTATVITAGFISAGDTLSLYPVPCIIAFVFWHSRRRRGCALQPAVQRLDFREILSIRNHASSCVGKELFLNPQHSSMDHLLELFFLSLRLASITMSSFALTHLMYFILSVCLMQAGSAA